MGGDFAPQATVAGALLALKELDSKHAIQLVGRTAVITETLDTLLRSPEYAPLAAQRDRVTIVEAPDVIEMADKPGAAIRGVARWTMSRSGGCPARCQNVYGVGQGCMARTWQ